MLPNLVIALIVIAGSIFLARVLNKAISKVAKKYYHDPMITGLAKNLTSLVIILLGLFLALAVMNLDKTVTSLLAGAGIIGLALGFAFQDIALNMISGIGIILKKPLKVGDIIETDGQFGEITNVRLRTTLLRLPSGQHALIPNKELFQNRVNVYTTGLRRVELELGVSYSDNLEKVKSVSLSAIKKLDFVKMKPEPKLYFKGFGDSSINLMLFFWIEYQNQADFFYARSEAIIAIKEAYDENSIDIPFPIRTLYMNDNSEKSKQPSSLVNHSYTNLN